MLKKLLLSSLLVGALSYSNAQTLVKDINPSGNGSPYIFGDLNGKLLIYVNDGVNGDEPWVSDGTESGTSLLKNIRAGISSSEFSSYYIKVGNEYFFVACDISSLNMGLYKTDGTSNGTVLVKNLGQYPVPQGGGNITPLPMCEFNGKLYFSTQDWNGKELWVSDGTDAGTKILKDINGAGDSDPFGFTVYKNHLYFYATENSSGRELWRTDGTESGTQLFKDIYPGTISSFPSTYASFFVFKDKLYFGAQGTHDEGVELYVSDGTAANTVLFKDINTTVQGNSYPTLVGLTDNYFVLRASTTAEGVEAFISDGTANGTKLLKDIASGTESSFPNSGVSLGNKIVFTTYTTEFGAELWVTDGSSANTMLLKDIDPGENSGYYGFLTKLDNRLFFTGITAQRGMELWETDGTPAGTLLNKDLVPGTAGSSLSNLYAMGGKLYFSANIDSKGQELYVMVPGQGTSISNIQSLKSSIYPNPVNANGYLYLGNGLENTEINIMDAQGKSYTFTSDSNGKVELNGSLSAGMYFIIIPSGIESMQYKLIIEH
ncbi:MAG TPA: ELWxxDGT repeat protein [Bacteroidia bacterium]